MVDLAGVLAVARAQFATVLATSGTTVDVLRPAGDLLGGAVNLTTLAAAPPTYTPVAAGVAALVLPAGSSDPGVPQSYPAQAGDLSVFLPPDVPTPAPGDVVRVTASLDGALRGRTLAVVFVEASSAGVTRRVVCSGGGAVATTTTVGGGVGG